MEAQLTCQHVSRSDAEPAVRFGGIQKQSLIDYPGKLSCVLFLTGCNLDCPYCHNPALARGEVPGPETPDTDEVLDFLSRRRDFLEGVVISGGEPTLQSGLVTLCADIRALGYPVKLDTNGSRPGMLERLIEAKLVDYIAMDVKTHPLLYRHHLQSECDPAAFLESIRLIIESGIDHEFRTTCVKPIVSPGIIDAIARLITGARRFVLQRFRHTEILRPDFFQNGQSHPYTKAELRHLKAIAADQVASCLVR
jgi:pyruvate formate lyase activating enzyme